MIRDAREEDLPELIRMAHQFLAATAFSHVPLDEGDFTQLIRGLMSGSGAVFVATKGEGLCGMLAMVSFPHYFNARFAAAQEFFWWIDPDARGNGAAMRLLAAAESWARGKGCSTLHMLALDALDGEKVIQIYERLGYIPLERTYMKVL